MNRGQNVLNKRNLALFETKQKILARSNFCRSDSYELTARFRAKLRACALYLFDILKDKR